MGWFLAGMLVGLVVAWGGEYFLDWRWRARDSSLHGEERRALQAALQRAQAELAQARNEVARVHSGAGAAQGDMLAAGAQSGPALAAPGSEGGTKRGVSE